MMKLITQYQTSKFFVGKINTCQYVVLHHTGKWKGIDIVKYLATNPAQASCHYVVDVNGDIYQLATDDKCTRHAGVSKRDGKENLNLYSIGIEIVSDGATFTDAQRSAVRDLVWSLIAKYKLWSDRIIRHKDIAPGRKWDVGDNFRNNQFANFAEYQNSYTKKPVSQYPDAIEAMKAGIRNGERPKDPATREEVATMIWRATQI